MLDSTILYCYTLISSKPRRSIKMKITSEIKINELKINKSEYSDRQMDKLLIEGIAYYHKPFDLTTREYDVFSFDVNKDDLFISVDDIKKIKVIDECGYPTLVAFNESNEMFYINL